MFESADCCCIESGSIVTREENKKVFSIRNARRRPIQVCKVDKCLIPGSQSTKCDFLFVLDTAEVKKVILVEFKGTDHVHALEQLVSTAEQLQINRRCSTIETFIVGSPNPKARLKVQKEILKISARYKAAGVSLPVIKSDQHSVVWE